MQLFNTALLNKVPLYAVCSVLTLVLAVNVLAQEGHPISPSQQVASAELPDSPGAVVAQEQEPSPQQDTTPQSATPSSPQTQDSQTQSSPDQTQKPQRPVGTAAAEAPNVSGVTAAQPAGVAIAPAKQRRVRTIVLKVGAMVGAGVAVGTVIALTAGTSSKPPGAK